MNMHRHWTMKTAANVRRSNARWSAHRFFCFDEHDVSFTLIYIGIHRYCIIHFYIGYIIRIVHKALYYGSRLPVELGTWKRRVYSSMKSSSSRALDGVASSEFRNQFVLTCPPAHRLPFRLSFCKRNFGCRFSTKWLSVLCQSNETPTRFVRFREYDFLIPCFGSATAVGFF